MVITLKGGAQLRFDVDDFTTELDYFTVRVDDITTRVYNRSGVEDATMGMAPLGAALQSLKWMRAAGSMSSLAWLDPGEVAAIHGEDMRPFKSADHAG
jgi:hypothetical protein